MSPVCLCVFVCLVSFAFALVLLFCLFAVSVIPFEFTFEFTLYSTGWNVKMEIDTVLSFVVAAVAKYIYIDAF